MISKPNMVALSRCACPETGEVACDLTVCVDTESHAALVVLRINDRVRSWWSARASANAMLVRYRAAGLNPTCELAEPLRHVVERRWPEVEALRAEIARA